jgi:hypothetical protein
MIAGTRITVEFVLERTGAGDFGELAFRQGLVHSGVILMRLAGLPASAKTGLLIGLIEAHRSELTGSFTVLSPGMVRIRKDTPRL